MGDPTSDLLSIAELAERVGLTRRTIRFYVAEGLLPPPGGRGQRRVYSSEHLIRLRAIQRLKEAFLPLSEIRRRFEAMTPSDLRRLASTEPDHSRCDDPCEIAANLSRPGRYPPVAGGPFLASQSVFPIGRALETALGFRGEAAAPRVIGPVQPESEGPASSVWHRATLAPGVELHYQLTGDRRRDEAIAHLIRTATSILR